MEPAELDALIDRFAAEGDSALLDSLDAAIDVSDGTAEVERLNRVMADLSTAPPVAGSAPAPADTSPLRLAPPMQTDGRPARWGLALGLAAAMASIALLTSIPVATPDPSPVWRGADGDSVSWENTLQDGLRRSLAPNAPMLVRVSVDSAGRVHQLESVDAHVVLEIPHPIATLPAAPMHHRGTTLDVWIQ